MRNSFQGELWKETKGRLPYTCVKSSCRQRYNMVGEHQDTGLIKDSSFFTAVWNRV